MNFSGCFRGHGFSSFRERAAHLLVRMNLRAALGFRTDRGFILEAYILLSVFVEHMLG